VEASDLLRATRDALARTGVWEAGPLEASLRELADARSLSAGKIFQPLRVALTGLPVSPGIFEMLLQMGRELSLRRIDKALSVLGA
jgi:glutamyl-tRNA synthetase